LKAERLPEINQEILASQGRYLSWLRRRTIKELRKHHANVFHEGHAYEMELPTWSPRYYYERRCYYWYCAVHYHLPEPFRRTFRKEAHSILRFRISDETRAADMDILRELRDFRKFTKNGISLLSEDRVDQFLLRLGYVVDVPLDQKRQILFELYNMHRGDIVPRYSLTTGKPIRYRTTGKSIRQLIIENPMLGYQQMLDKYGKTHDIKATYFYHTRSHLRKAGYDLPPLVVVKRGIIVDGKKSEAGRDLEAATHSSRYQRKKSLDLSTADEDF